MGLSADQLRLALDALADRDPGIAESLGTAGYPEPRIRPRGYETLLRTIIGQQLSVLAANAMWTKFAALTGQPGDPDRLLAANDEELRACGFSRQKMGYARGLAEAAQSGTLRFEALPEDDEEAIRQLTALKGIGRWSAEIYLLFSEGRGDVFPAGDLAVQVEAGRLLGLPERPAEKALRTLAERWRPYRGALSIFLWHRYNTAVL